MFSRIQTRNFRSLKSIDQGLGAFQALVGPNASGKTTFLDVIGLMSDIVRSRGDVQNVVRNRSADFQGLLWKGAGNSFQLAVEAPLPTEVIAKLSDDKKDFALLRYEIEIGIDRNLNELGLDHETLWLKKNAPNNSLNLQRSFFPNVPDDDSARILQKPGRSLRAVITKKPGGNDYYYTEGKKKSYKPSFHLGRTRSALSNIPADRESFPASTWFRELLENGVQNIVLNSHMIRQPSPPGLGLRFLTDGSNLPWVIDRLRQDPQRFGRWIEHVRTALEDIRDIVTIERQEDRHRYLVIEYQNGAHVPSWLASDGTLRLLALTIPAYLQEQKGVFLIEEPENGIHPRAIETILHSLSSIYDSQVLIATHSPVALNLLEPNELLCFAKDPKTGATDVIGGEEHPALKLWKQGQPDLGILFASGILS